jgi:chromate reductase, NAD(P)H dehydrogenase (quinone)
MITIISGTNRQDSMTLRVATLYHRIISSKVDNVFLLSLENQNVWERSADMITLEEKYLIPSEKFVFIMPEYNASFPGILKVMMDNCNIKKCWWYKKAMLTGVSDGRAGNLRGIEHMTSILHYMKVNVLYNKVLLSRINDEMDAMGNLRNAATAKAIEQQIDEFINF